MEYHFVLLNVADSLPKRQPKSGHVYPDPNMKTLNLERAKERVAHQYTEEELMPLLLFRGNWEMGKAQALYKIALMMMDVEVPSIARIRDITREGRDLIHMTGLHEYAKIGLDLRSTLNRIRLSPTVLALNPDLEDYVYWVRENTGDFFYNLDTISRYSIWTNRKWRYPYKIKNRKIQIKKSSDNGIIVPQFYPFITDKPQEEHELLMWAHNLVPKTIPEHWRQDICQDLIVALLTGEITKECAASSIQKYIKKVFREYPSKYGPLSLDQELSWDDDRTLLDKISGSTLR